ncbi:hypothetical protein [Streptomyces sp. NPDC048196]|uniref:hypothetical protein n=1 Tax=Streptomyces sp. NPDC048196 TaxID=3154712 RepID=UPI0033C594B2
MLSGREPNDGSKVLSGREPSDGFTVLPSVHVAERRVAHLVEDGHVPEAVRTDPLQCALAFQEEGAEWLHLVMTEEHGGFDMDSASRIIDALDINVQRCWLPWTAPAAPATSSPTSVGKAA